MITDDRIRVKAGSRLRVDTTTQREGNSLVSDCTLGASHVVSQARRFTSAECVLRRIRRGGDAASLDIGTDRRISGEV